MNKNEINVFHFDNEPTESSFVGNALETLGEKYNLKVNFQSATTIEESKKIILGTQFQLIIVDLLVGDEVMGERILTFLEDKQSQVPVWILTHASELEVDLNALKKKYIIVSEVIKKTHNLDELKDIAAKFLERNELLIDDALKNTDRSDYQLQSDINLVGIENINTIIIRLKTNKVKKYSISRIGQFSSGYSGAIIFELFYLDESGNQKSILCKISKNREAIEKEYNNVKLYEEFPPRLKVSYLEELKHVLATDKVSALVIENAKNSTTLLKYLLNKSTTTTQIEEVFSSIYFEDGLSQFYKDNPKGKEKFIDSCLNQLDFGKISYIKKSIRELTPILKLHPKYFDDALLNTILGDKSYSHLRKDNMTEDKFFKNRILSHGDLHSKNLLISNIKYPHIIDTGGMNASGSFWCYDISRLMVSLLLEGIDFEDVAFFKLESIKKWINQAIGVIKGDEELIMDSSTNSNINISHSLKWLRKNVITIYHGYNDEWEIQLGLALEFLKACYRSESLPPGKRAFAILAACEAIKISNTSFHENYLKK